MSRPVYIHRPLFGVAIALACGIAVGARMNVSYMTASGAAIVAVFIILGTFNKRCSVWIMLGLFVVLGIASVSSVRYLSSDHVGYLTYDERRDVLNIEGIVVSDPFMRRTARGEKMSFELAVEAIAFNGQWVPKQGKVMVNIFRKTEVVYGQRLRLSGRLHKPFEQGFSGNFSYGDYLKRNGIYWIMSVKRSAPLEVLAQGRANSVQSLFLGTRRKLQSILERYLTAFEAGIVQSLVLGGKYYLPDRTRELFVQTGTAHILAISGMNVGAMAFLVFLGLNVLRLPRAAQIFLTATLLIMYCVLTGANPSVVRATVMAVVMLGGLLVERRTDTLNSLGLAASVILCLDPMSLFDIGFQLSFMGVFSIIGIYPLLYRIFEGITDDRFSIMMIQSLCISLAAFIGVLPLVAYYFQIVAPVSIVANIPVIPFVSALFMLGAGLLVAGTVCPALAVTFAACIKVVLFALMTVVDLFSRVPGGYVYTPHVELSWVCAYYVLLGVSLAVLARVSERRPTDENLHFLS